MNQPEKYALVTGASSGIGRHISIELAQRGYSIIAVSNQPEQLDHVKEGVGGHLCRFSLYHAILISAQDRCRKG